jgi:hypothetical protein
VPQQRRCTHLPSGPSTVDENRFARDEGSCAGGKEYDHARHIHRLPNAVQRSNAFYYVRPELGIGETTLRPRSTYESAFPTYARSLNTGGDNYRDTSQWSQGLKSITR